MAHAKNEIGLRDHLANGARVLRGFLANQAGASFVITALAFPVVLGMAGIGVDAVLWYMTKRQNQTIADNGAVAGMIALSRDGNISQADLKQAVWDSAASNGFVNNTNGTVTVNSPPQRGPNAGNVAFVEVIVEEPSDLYFSRWLMRTPFNIQSRAVSGVSYFGEHCVVALDPSADSAIKVIGTADVTSDCGLASNSSSASAIDVSGKATLDAVPLQAYGDISESGAGQIIYDVPPQPLSERVEDPYATVLPGLQASPSCVGATQKLFGSTDSPLSPGRFCGGITINGNVDFNPGLYIIDNGDFNIVGGGDIRGPGVTLILTAMDAADLGSADFSGGGTVELRSPTAAEAAATGGYEGMLMIQDPYVPNLDTASLPKNMLTGGTNMQLDGALYFPDMETVYTGGTNGGVNCTLIVSKRVTFEGNVYLDNDATACAQAGVTSGIQQTRIRLFE